jgi:hypothetical protein
MFDFTIQVHQLATMANNLDLAFSLQTPLEKAKDAFVSLDQENASVPQLSDRRTAMLEWMRFLQRRLKAVDGEIAAKLSTNAKEARETSRRDHELASAFSREELRDRELRKNEGLMALELSREPGKTQAVILQNIQDEIAHDRRQAADFRVLQAPGALQALRVPHAAKPPRAPKAPTNKQQINQPGKRPAPDEPNERPTKRLRMDPVVPQVPQVRHECVACSETFLEVQLLTGSCSHRYCRFCLGRLLENALTDETLFPPVCCRRNLLVENAQAFISTKMWMRYEEKKIEHNDKSRTYCSNPICSSYILPTQIRTQNATCTKCTQQTCIRCKTMAHVGECPENDEAVLTKITDGNAAPTVAMWSSFEVAVTTSRKNNRTSLPLHNPRLFY